MLARLLWVWNRLEEVVLGWTLLGLALFSFVQVILRYAFAAGFDWSEELGRYLSILLTFLGASVGVKHGTHFSVEALVQALPPRGAHACKALANLLTAALFGVVVWYGWVHTSKLHRFGVRSASLPLPMWLPYAPIPALSAAIAIRFLVRGLSHARHAVDGTPYAPEE